MQTSTRDAGAFDAASTLRRELECRRAAHLRVQTSTRAFDPAFRLRRARILAAALARADVVTTTREHSILPLVPWTSDFPHISTRSRRRSLRCAPRKETHPSFVARLASDADPAPIYAGNH